MFTVLSTPSVSEGDAVAGISHAEFGVFVPGRGVVGEYVDGPDARQGRGEKSRGADVFLIVVDSRDEREPEVDPCPAVCQQAQIGKNQGVVHTGGAAMGGRVHVFYIVEKKISMPGYARDRAGGGESAGVHSAVQVQVSAGPQQGFQKIGLGQRLAAGEGHPAAAFGEEGDFLLDLLNYCFNRAFHAHAFVGQGRADFGAKPAGDAGFLVADHAAAAGEECALRARRDAFSAADALSRNGQHER